MRLSELQSKNIVNVLDGKNIGNIVDANVDTNGNIESFVVEERRGLFSLSKDNNRLIYWKDIKKIGEDVILVEKR